MNLSDYLNRGTCQCIVAEFDNTLFGWYDVLDEESMPRSTEMTFDFLTGMNWYAHNEDTCIPVQYMQEFMTYMRPKIQRAFCLSCSDWSAPYSPMTKQIIKHYKGLFDNVLFAGTREAKVDVLDRLSKTFGYSHNQILLVDSHPLTCSEAREAGFATIAPVGIYLFVENLRKMSNPSEDFNGSSNYQQIKLDWDKPDFERDIALK